MKKYFLAAVVAASLIGMSILGATAKEKVRSAPQVEILSENTMKKLFEVNEPVEQHRLLSSLAGTWHYDLNYWKDKDSSPQSSSGTIENEMVLGKRFLSSKTTLILNIGGQSIPYEGWGLLGYDTSRNVFTSVWADTQRTGFMSGEGQYNEKAKTIREEGRFTHPLLDREQKFSSELRFIDEKSYSRTINIYDDSGKEFKVLEINFSKRP